MTDVLEFKNKEWKISNSGYCKAKLLLSKNWCVDNVQKFAKHRTVIILIFKLKYPN